MAKKQNRRYEDLYNQLADLSMNMHKGNKRRIRIGLVLLALLPVLLIVIRWLTDSDKVVFLLIWVFCMFALCIYLISVEYIDSTLQKTLEEVTNTEAGFDELLLDSEGVRIAIQGRIHERFEEFLSEGYYETTYEGILEKRAMEAEAEKNHKDGGAE